MTGCIRVSRPFAGMHDARTIPTWHGLGEIFENNTRFMHHRSSGRYSCHEIHLRIEGCSYTRFFAALQRKKNSEVTKQVISEAKQWNHHVHFTCFEMSSPNGHVLGLVHLKICDDVLRLFYLFTFLLFYFSTLHYSFILGFSGQKTYFKILSLYTWI